MIAGVGHVDRMGPPVGARIATVLAHLRLPAWAGIGPSRWDFNFGKPDLLTRIATGSLFGLDMDACIRCNASGRCARFPRAAPRWQTPLAVGALLKDRPQSKQPPWPQAVFDEASCHQICAVLDDKGGTRTMAADMQAGCSLAHRRPVPRSDRAFARELAQGLVVECEIRCLRSLSNAAQDPTQWQAAAWMLERLWPERYGRRKHVGLMPRRSTRAVPRHR